MFKYLLTLSCVCLLACSILAGSILKEKGSELLQKHQESVVFVQVVFKTRITALGKQYEATEHKSSSLGTVLSEDGLIAVANSAISPPIIVKHYGMDDDEVAVKFETEMTSLKIIMPNGKEQPAKVMARDKDLDLAFLRPESKNVRFTSLAIEKSPVPEIGDELCWIYRLPKDLNWQPGVASASVGAIVNKPRTLVCPNLAAGNKDFGCPVFNRDGKVVGILVNNPGAEKEILSVPVVLPAEEILQAVAQVNNCDDK